MAVRNLSVLFFFSFECKFYEFSHYNTVVYCLKIFIGKKIVDL